MKVPGGQKTGAIWRCWLRQERPTRRPRRGSTPRPRGCRLGKADAGSLEEPGGSGQCRVRRPTRAESAVVWPRRRPSMVKPKAEMILGAVAKAETEPKWRPEGGLPRQNGEAGTGAGGPPRADTRCGCEVEMDAQRRSRPRQRNQTELEPASRFIANAGAPPQLRSEAVKSRKPRKRLGRSRFHEVKQGMVAQAPRAKKLPDPPFYCIAESTCDNRFAAFVLAFHHNHRSPGIPVAGIISRCLKSTRIQ